MRKVVMAYSGKASEFASFLQGMYPSNVVLISAYKQKKTASAKAASKKKSSKTKSIFILSDFQE